ncbi:hypothetical protein MC885_003751, partial [Smutsia gigantea]
RRLLPPFLPRPPSPPLIGRAPGPPCLSSPTPGENCGRRAGCSNWRRRRVGRRLLPQRTGAQIPTWHPSS